LSSTAMPPPLRRRRRCFPLRPQRPRIHPVRAAASAAPALDVAADRFPSSSPWYARRRARRGRWCRPRRGRPWRRWRRRCCWSSYGTRRPCRCGSGLCRSSRLWWSCGLWWSSRLRYFSPQRLIGGKQSMHYFSSLRSRWQSHDLIARAGKALADRPIRGRQMRLVFQSRKQFLLSHGGSLL